MASTCGLSQVVYVYKQGVADVDAYMYVIDTMMKLAGIGLNCQYPLLDQKSLVEPAAFILTLYRSVLRFQGATEVLFR